jgi:hypothetical protein
VLYFGLIELLLMDASRELKAARQFRARIVAQTLAENAAEGAAWMLLDPTVPPEPFDEENEQGTMSGRMTKNVKAFKLTGVGVSAGLEKTRANVLLEGYLENGEIHVDVSVHSQ